MRLIEADRRGEVGRGRNGPIAVCSRRGPASWKSANVGVGDLRADGASHLWLEESVGMSVGIDPDVLRREMARRGWRNTDLARAARISDATVSAACAGKPVSAVTLKLIAEALATAPALIYVDRLLR